MLQDVDKLLKLDTNSSLGYHRRADIHFNTFNFMIYSNLVAGLKALPHPKKTMIKVPNASAIHSNNNFGSSDFFGMSHIVIL